MHILILSHYWPPEIGASSHLTYELGETLVQLGNQVTVVTGMPSYNLKTVPERYRGRFTFEEKIAGMRVLRVRTGSVHSRSAIRRGVEHLLAGPLYAWRALGLRRVDVVYTVSPPLMMGIASWLTARRHRAQCCLSVQDLFPQNAVDLGLMKNKMAILFFEALERLAYQAAGAVVVHSEGNRAHIVAKGKPADQVHSLPNWVDTNVIRPAERHNDFRREHGLEQEFIVSFAGTMGWSQGLEVVIETARLLAREPDLLFLLIGGGTQRERLGRLADRLPNVRFLPMQSKEKYPSVLAASDACLVTLRPEVATPVVPSKLLTIMAAGRPVLASVPLGGDAPRIVNDAACGFVVPPGDAQALAEAVLRLKRDSGIAREKAVNGREWAERHFSRTACIRRFESIFRSLSRRPDDARVPRPLPSTGTASGAWQRFPRR